MKANFGFGDILVHLLIWLVIIVITFGIGAFFFPYSFAKFVVNHSQVQMPGNTDGAQYQLKCDLDVFSQIGHIILWIIITLVTFGLGYLFYIYGVWRIVLRNTHLRRIDSSLPVAS